MLGQLPRNATAGRPGRAARHRNGTVAFWLAAVGYLAFGLWLALDVRFFLGDALSRVQGAQAVLFSREPHLVAMGFVFTPLSTLAELPLVAFSPLMPELTRYGVAGVVVSALFMAGAVRQLWLLAHDRGAPLWFTVVVTALFALHPVILLYAATGMSEAPFCFTFVWACRRLIRWLGTDDVHDLVVAGVAVALAFLARYDGVVLGAAGALLVGAVTWWRSRTTAPRFHRGYAVLDMLVFLGPLGLAVGTWTAASWLSTGDLLAQFSSSYGNAAIIAQTGETTAGLPALLDSLVRILLLAPMLPLLMAMVAWLAWRRRDFEPVVPVIAAGSVLVFQTLTAVQGATFGFLRFFLVAVVLTGVLLVQCAPVRGELSARRFGRAARSRRLSRPVPPGLLALVTLAVLGGNAVTVPALWSPHWAPQEHALQQVLPTARDQTFAETEQQRRILRTFATERRLADYLDAREMGEGAVLTDTTYGFAVLTASADPRQFTIPSDPDFITRLGEPAGSGVDYILTVPPEGRGANDPVNRRYPSLYEDGAGIATLELEIPNTGEEQPDWRLYRVHP